MAGIERHEREFHLSLIEEPNTQQVLFYSRRTFPWFPNAEEDVTVRLYHAQGGVPFYYGRLVVGGLVKYARRLERQGKMWPRMIDSTLSTRLSEWVEKNYSNEIFHIHGTANNNDPKIRYIKPSDRKPAKYRPFFAIDAPFSIIENNQKIWVPKGRLADRHVIISLGELTKADEDKGIKEFGVDEL